MISLPIIMTKKESMNEARKIEVRSYMRDYMREYIKSHPRVRSNESKQKEMIKSYIRRKQLPSTFSLDQYQLTYDEAKMACQIFGIFQNIAGHGAREAILRNLADFPPLVKNL